MKDEREVERLYPLMCVVCDADPGCRCEALKQYNPHTRACLAGFERRLKLIERWQEEYLIQAKLNFTWRPR